MVELLNGQLTQLESEGRAQWQRTVRTFTKPLPSGGVVFVSVFQTFLEFANQERPWCFLLFYFFSVDIWLEIQMGDYRLSSKQFTNQICGGVTT